MPRAQRAERLARLRAGVARHDLNWWLHRQLLDLGRVAARRDAASDPTAELR
jgi:hypothetical protein